MDDDPMKDPKAWEGHRPSHMAYTLSDLGPVAETIVSIAILGFVGWMMVWTLLSIVGVL